MVFDVPLASTKNEITWCGVRMSDGVGI